MDTGDKGFQFPCEFQIKAMGLDDGYFQDVVVEIVSQHCECVDQQRIVCKPSKNGKYVSVNVTIEAQSLDHLNTIYDALTAHDKVLMRL